MPRSRVSRAASPCRSGRSPVGSLTVFAGGDPLFVEDDRVLLGLLAEQAARSAERQEAILERNVLESVLEDQSHELADHRPASMRRRASALPSRRTRASCSSLTPTAGSATQRAGPPQSPFVPDQIRAVHLRDLLTTAPAVGQATHGVQLAEARRRDGTTFPVDYAVSTFDLGGDTYSIAVLTDISERLQTERLRDTFIGMLSHELRTPVTSIYGGSQVLLNRGDRLEAETRQELIADVASEAERLHRLIENLLVLARVERGQDLAGDEPVLLRASCR